MHLGARITKSVIGTVSDTGAVRSPVGGSPLSDALIGEKVSLNNFLTLSFKYFNITPSIIELKGELLLPDDPPVLPFE
jgi:hypothetical protein